VSGRGAGVLVDPDRPNFDHLPGYLPVVGGVRHVTTLAGRPPAGTFVETLCGARYQVARRRWRVEPDARYDCSFCALELAGVER
jgi:hypothetical protein